MGPEYISPENTELVFEKDGKEVDSLPQDLKDSIEFLVEKGLTPAEKPLLLPESCQPKVGEWVPVSERDALEGLAEVKLKNMITDLLKKPVSERVIAFDFCDFPRIKALNDVMRELRSFIAVNQIQIKFTPRMMTLIRQKQLEVTEKKLGY